MPGITQPPAVPLWGAVSVSGLSAGLATPCSCPVTQGCFTSFSPRPSLPPEP